MSDINTKSDEDARLDINEEGDETEVGRLAHDKADAQSLRNTCIDKATGPRQDEGAPRRDRGRIGASSEDGERSRAVQQPTLPRLAEPARTQRGR